MFFWLVIGILISFCGYFVWEHVAKTWSGESLRIDSDTIVYKLVKSKYGINQIKIGLLCNSNFKFELKKESLIDRFFKTLHLSKEQQTNNHDFDEMIYIVSDDHRLTNILKFNEEVQNTIYGAFVREAVIGYTVEKIACNNSLVWVDIKVGKRKSTIEPEEIKTIARAVIPCLTTLIQSLRNMTSNIDHQYDRTIYPAAILTGISVGLLSSSFLEYISLASHFPVTLKITELFKTSILIGMAATISLGMVWFATLAGTSRAHSVFMNIVFAGLIGAVGNAFFMVRNYNIEFDKHNPIMRTATVIEKYTKKCGRKNRSTCYYLKVDAISPYFNYYAFKVPHTLYDNFTETDQATVVMHMGALGYPWISDIVKSDSQVK